MQPRYLILLALLALATARAGAQVRLLVAGNTADATPAYYSTLQAAINAPSAIAPTVLFAGDYIDECTNAMLAYNTQSTDGAEVFASVQPIIDLLRNNPGVDFYFVPGDRDWDASGKDGRACVRALEGYLEAQQLGNLYWSVGRGCPGPEVINLSASVKLMLLNTQWWNHPYDKPVPADAACNFSDPSIVYDEILAGIEENRDHNVIIAGHYPPTSQGRRGGKFPARDHFTPPIIGSFRLSFRQNVGTRGRANQSAVSGAR